MSAPTQNELTAMLKAMGWKLDKVLAPTKTSGRYVAKGTGPAGQKGERDGDTPERAIGNLLLFAQHHNAIRSYASLGLKLATWQTPWAHQLEEIGQAYGKLPVYDKNAVSAWHALANESKMQADAIRKQVNVNVTDDPEPYPHHAAMLHDIHHNQNFIVSRAHSDHPVWSPEDNVNFRIVHDVLGHGQSGGDFGWEGENRACGIHFPMVSPLARRALFTECIGQTAYALRKGSHGFGPQKVALMPEFLDPVEKMNGEHVHVPSGKLAYPEEIMPTEQGNPAWGWHQDPADGMWKQTPGVNPSAAEPGGALSGVHSSAYQSTPGMTPYIPPHHQTPLEYPDRAAHVSIEPSDEYPDLLPHTAADPNMYAHSKYVAPLTQPGGSDDYIRRGDVEHNVGKFAQPEDPFVEMHPEKQRQVIRNAFSAVILSPRKDLKGNAQQYQAIADLPADAPLGDVFHKIMSARNYHNFHTVPDKSKDAMDLGSEHGMFGMNRPTYEKQLRDLHAYIKSTQDVSDAKAWENTKKTLAEMYKQVEPHAELAVEKEGGDINTMRVRIKTIELANAWLESILGGPRDWADPGEQQNLFGEPAGLSPERGPGQVPTELPTIPVMSKTAGDADVPEDENDESRYSGVVYGHLESIANITAAHLEIMRQYAVKDINEDGGRGFIFRAGCVALNVPGIGPKTASFAWLLIEPHSSELGIIDTHVLRGLGFEDHDLTNQNYHMMERMQRNLKDSTGYGDMPLGKFHWGMWDMMRTPGRVSDHRALRPHNFMPWDHPDMEHGSSLGNKPIARDEEPIYVGPEALRKARPLLEQVQDEWYASQKSGRKRPASHYRQGLTPDRPANPVPATWQPTAKTVMFGNVPSWLEQKPDGTYGPKDEALAPYDATWPDVRAASTDWAPSQPGTQFKPGDRVQLHDGQFGTVLSVEPAPEYQVGDECEMCGAPTEGNINPEDGTCRNCNNDPHEHDDTSWVNVKLDSGQTVNAADSHLHLADPMTDAPNHVPLHMQPGAQTPQPGEAVDMIRGAGFSPFQQPSPHGGFANTNDTICADCGTRVIGGASEGQSCKNCGRPANEDDKRPVSGPYDPTNKDMRADYDTVKRSTPGFQPGDRVTWGPQNEPATIKGLRGNTGGQEWYYITTDKGNTMTVREDHITPEGAMPAAMPEFPEPTGQTIPNDLSGWSDAEQDYYRNAAIKQGWADQPPPNYMAPIPNVGPTPVTKGWQDVAPRPGTQKMCPHCGAQLKAGVRDWCNTCHRKIYSRTSAFNPAEYIEQAGGNEMEATQELYKDIKATGMEDYAAWTTAQKMIRDHSHQLPGTSDMSEFENRPTTDPGHELPDNDDWGPTAEHPEDFNPKQPDWKPAEDQSSFSPEKAFKPGDHVVYQTDSGLGGLVIQVNEGQMLVQFDGGGKKWVSALDMKRAETPRSEANLPEFPEPSGATVPDTIPWGDAEQDYYRRATVTTEWE